MTAPQIIEHAQGLGVTLWRDGDSLAVRGPAGKLSPKALERLRELKPLLLPMLPEAPKLEQVGTVSGPQLEKVGKVFAPNSEAPERLPMERAQPHGAHGNFATYERPTPHKAATPHARQDTPCTGGSLEELGAEVDTLLCMQSLLIAFENGRVPSSVFPSLHCPSGRRVDNPVVAVRGMLQRSEVLAQGGRIGSKLAGADLQDWPFLAAWWSVGSSKAPCGERGA